MKRSRLVAVVPILVGSLFVGGTAFASPDGHSARHHRTTSSVDHNSKDRSGSSSEDTSSPDAVPHH